jgi:hypothetical protein
VSTAVSDILYSCNTASFLSLQMHPAFTPVSKHLQSPGVPPAEMAAIGIRNNQLAIAAGKTKRASAIARAAIPAARFGGRGEWVGAIEAATI